MLLKNGIYIPGEKGNWSWWGSSARGYAEARLMERMVEIRAKQYRHEHSPKRFNPTGKYTIKGTAKPRRNLKPFHLNWL